MFALAPAAQAARPGVQRTTYKLGPLQVTPGQNRIGLAPGQRRMGNRPVVGKPKVDGWIVRIKPNLTNMDGSIPSSDRVMFHHGVWVNMSGNATSPLPERFFAAGEEKTIMKLPKGFGYHYRASDRWLLNHMIHNLTPQRMRLYITYTIDFIPESSAAARGIRPVRPIWMDVENGRGYPVFDSFKGSGKNGRFTYPSDRKNAYPNGDKRNTWTADRDGVLVSTAGHVHQGGLNTDLWLRRRGASYSGPRCAKRATALSRRKCRKAAPTVRRNKAHLFKSRAKYFEPAGPVSWDVAMTATPDDWRVAVKKGDTLEITTTYETKLASWYESMGIMVAYMAEGRKGKNPFRTKVNHEGKVTHGHLKENSVHGGKKTNLPDPRKLPSGVFAGGPLTINGFSYQAGDLRLPGAAKNPPTVKRGQSLTYVLGAGDARQEAWHSLSSCKAPCNRSTGIAYPIPDAKYQFDSGQLGDRTPAVRRRTWQTPKSLPVGTYTYFCRIHPFMRGGFRVKK